METVATDESNGVVVEKKKRGRKPGSKVAAQPQAKRSPLRQAAAEPKLIALAKKHDKLAKAMQEVQTARKALLATLSVEAKKLLNLGDA